MIAAHYSSGQLALTPQWMTEDWAGTAKQFQSLGRQIKGMYLMQYDPAAVVRYEVGLFDANARLAHESQKNLEGLGQQLQQELTRGDFYTYGKYTFDVASLFIGGAEIKGALNGTKIGTKTLEGLTAFKSMSRAALAKNSSQMVTKIERLLQYGDDTIKALTNKILDTPFQVGEGLAHAGASHSKTSTTLREFFKERGVVFGKVGREAVLTVPNKPLATLERFKEAYIVDYAGTMSKNYTEADIANLTKLTTHNAESKTALLGYFEAGSVMSYEQLAHANGFTYFDAGNKGWKAMTKVSSDLPFKVNDDFLVKQIQEGKNFVLTSDPHVAIQIADRTGKGKSYVNELKLLKENGYKIESYGNFWRAYK